MNSAPKTISASAFKELLKGNQQPQVVDVRTAAEVDSQFLPGSAHFPLQELNCAEVKAHLQQQGQDPQQPVYLLCASGQRAARAAEQLQNEIGCPLVVIDGGIGALNSAGVAIKQGGGTLISLERQVRIAAGSLVVIGVALGALVHPGFYGLAAFVGAGLVFAGVSDSCAMGMMLARMPWNNSSASKQ